MNLFLDFGNSRLKWGAGFIRKGDSSRLIERGAVDYTLAALTDLLNHLMGLPLRALHFSSVVSAEREQEVFTQLHPLGLSPQRFTVSTRIGTLTNAYTSPEMLGVDRWAAAIGAWSLMNRSCLVIGAGTATTIDVIEASIKGNQAIYRGGLILPGIELMMQSLSTATDRLPQATGRYRTPPDIADNTHDAITTGVVEATCGAIERLGCTLAPDAPWLLTGGAAQPIAEALGIRVTQVPDLVLEGLASDLDLRQATDVSA